VDGRRTGCPDQPEATLKTLAWLALAATLGALVLPERWYLLAWLPFAAGVAVVGRLPRRHALALVLVGGAALPLVAAHRPPNSSDDMYRYLWDGRVQTAGIDPYRYPPSAPELRRLRDGFLWPEHATWCGPSGCTRINRPDVNTIYPPVAEGVFAGAAVLWPHPTTERPWQWFASAVALAGAWFLWYALSRLNRDPRRAVLWAWCPLVALEAGNNGHVDVVAAVLSAVALWLFVRRRTVWAGVLLGLAVATKLTPALLGPALLRRRPVTLLAAAAGAVVTVYLPHLIAVGAGVIGFLPGYLHEEGYDDGSRFALLQWVLPGVVVKPAAVLILAAVALWVWRTSDPDRPWAGAATMVGAALLVSTPDYPWYVLLLGMLVAFGARVEWFAVALAAYLAQFAHDLPAGGGLAPRLGYLAALLVVVTGALVRQPTIAAWIRRPTAGPGSTPAWSDDSLRRSSRSGAGST
jgi:hypothetical protein